MCHRASLWSKKNYQIPGFCRREISVSRSVVVEHESKSAENKSCCREESSGSYGDGQAKAEQVEAAGAKVTG